MVDTRAKFAAPSSFGDDVVIETRVAAFRNSSFDVEHKLLKLAESGERLAIEAWETRVWVGRHPDDPGRLKSRPIPRRVVARLSGLDEAAHGG
jgi:4-hydroxybenzoyl-CoA thioesterase